MSQVDFLTYVGQNEDYIETVGKLLTHAVESENIQPLKEHLTLILAHRATLVTIAAHFERFLSRARKELLVPKSKEVTDKDRSVVLEDATSDHQYWCDIVAGFISTIDRQVSSTQTLLSYEKKALSQLGEGNV